MGRHSLLTCRFRQGYSGDVFSWFDGLMIATDFFWFLEDSVIRMRGGLGMRKFELLLVCFLGGSTGFGADTTVHHADELREVLRQVQPGDVITLAPGQYGNGVWIQDVTGTLDKPIIIRGADDQNPPVFRGGKEAMHFVDCNYVTLRNIRVSGCSGNGINADDGGSYETPSRGLVFERITIEDTGPVGNWDGLKLSGLDDFTVTNCTISGWGGSAIDMVGCHNGVIDGSKFIGKDRYSQNSGIQAKGGSENVIIRQNYFHDAGERAVNLGGSTGYTFFRPRLQDYEAKAIVVEGNHFVGSQAPIAYVTSIACVVRRNTIVNPRKWILRILQEQPLDKFQPCQRGVFEDNLVVFDKRVQVFVNVGPNTKPETFSFRGNAWYCSDNTRKPTLPVKETGGCYQIDPMVENAETPDLRIRSNDRRLRTVGAAGFGRDVYEQK